MDDEVWQCIKAEAEPLVDDENSVLRRLLGLEGVASGRRGRKAVEGSRRAPLGSLMHRDAYELPILEELIARGGSGPAREITEAVGRRVADQITDRDRETLASGSVRWMTRVQFTRLRMKERGLLKEGSPRGLWELTERGREAAEREEVGSSAQ